MQAKLAVFGSVNMDLVTQVTRFPQPGETLIAEGFAQVPGGKGANQAVAAARLGAPTAMFGRVGQDTFGADLRRSLQENGVDITGVETAPTTSGLAVILVNDGGENMIAILPGANGTLDPAFVDRVLARLGQAKILLLQLEVPLATLEYLLRHLPRGPLVILDPAPAQEIGNLPTERIDLLTPNQQELAQLTGLPTGNAAEIERAMTRLRVKLHIPRIICKAGAAGAFLLTENGKLQHFPGHRVQAVDTTAAGDAFNGGLAVALAEGRSLEEAIVFANAVGALTVTKEGAQPSLPRRAEVERFLTAHRPSVTG